MRKANDAFRTISEVANELGVPKHVLRFWESKFPQIKPMKRGGGRRYYRPEDLVLLGGIRTLLHADGYTIKGVQKILRERGVDAVKAANGGAPDLKTQSGKPTKRKAASKTTSREKAIADAAHAGAERQRVEEIDRIIKELEACRTLLVAGQPTKAPARRSKVPRKARASKSA